MIAIYMCVSNYAPYLLSPPCSHTNHGPFLGNNDDGLKGEDVTQLGFDICGTD